MIFKRAGEKDFEAIKQFYIDVIRNTPGMAKHTRWKEGIHPSDQTVKRYINQDCMYILKNGKDTVCAVAVQMWQDEEYRRIKWGIEAEDDEVATLHIFAISPKYQGNGYGRAILKETEKIALESGKKALRLDTLKSNLPAQSLYGSSGFSLMGSLVLDTPNAGLTEFLYYEKIFK